MDPLDTESETEAFGEAFTDEAETTVIHHSNLDTLILPQHLMNLQTAVMDSDTEITVVTIGKETPNQAFFIQEKHLSLTLQDIRDVLASQSLSLPSHFKFMSSSKNIIAIPTEQRITLKKLIGIDDNHNDAANAQLLVCSMRSKKRKRKTRADDREDLQNDDIGSDATNEGDVEGTATGPGPQRAAAQPTRESSRCPMQSFNRVLFNTREGNAPFTGGCPIQMLNWKVLFRALVGFSIALIAMILLLLLTFYSLTCIMSMSINAPGIMPDSDDVIKMKMKIGELEVSHRYDLQDLKSRLDNIENQATAHSKRMAENMATIVAKFERGTTGPYTDTLSVKEAKCAQMNELNNVDEKMNAHLERFHEKQQKKEADDAAAQDGGDARRERSYTKTQEKEKSTQKAP